MNKMKAFNVLFAAFALVVGAGCNVRLVDKAAGDGPRVEDATEPAEIVAERTGEWNQYRLRIPARLVQGPVTRSLVGARTAAKPKSFRASGASLVDEDVRGGDVYEYSFYNGDGSSEPHVVRVVVPMDLVVDHDLDLDNDELGRRFRATQKFGHLIFKNVVVKTWGHNLNIVADDISFDETTLKSFEAGETAALGDGRSGGVIHIKTKLASGLLKLELRGENGADGQVGQVRTAQNIGFDQLRAHALPMMGGWQMGSTCIPMPGKPGVEGPRGFDGGRGGDSGEVLIFADDRTLLKMAPPILEIGLGGRGGPGGEGAPGEKAVFCRTEGPHGPRGDAGVAGLPGVIKQVCFIDAGRNPDCL